MKNVQFAWSVRNKYQFFVPKPKLQQKIRSFFFKIFNYFKSAKISFEKTEIYWIFEYVLF